MPLSDWRRLYVPYLVDPIKWSPTFDYDYFYYNRGEFISLWYHELLRHPGTYFQAWADQTKGFWDPFTSKPPQYAETQIDPNRYGIAQTNLLAKFTGIDMSAALAYDQIPKYFIGAGLLVWVTALVSVLVIVRKRTRLLIVLIPALSTIGIMFVSTPLGYSLRYVVCLVFTLPLMVFLPFSEVKESRAS